MALNKTMTTILFTLITLSYAYAKTKDSLDRSYQVATLPLVNGAQGLQYYASGGPPGIVYPNVPATVFIPGQIGVLNLPPGVTQPTSSGVIPSDQPSPSYQPTYSPPRPSYKPAHQQQQSSPIFTIEQSIDLTDVTTASPVPSTYGPPKSVDVHFRRPTHNHIRTYYRHKVPHPMRGPRPPSNRPLMYTHVHKGHLHTHYIPPPSVYHKHPSPTYSVPSTTASPTTESPPPSIYNYHAHPPGSTSPSRGNTIKFPDSSNHGLLTQAVIGQSGVIANYDTNLPVKIPSPKPNQLEVKEILKNSDLHFVDVLENRPTTASPPTHQAQQFYEKPSVPNQQATYQTHPYPAADAYEQLYNKYKSQESLSGLYGNYHGSDEISQQPFRPYAELYDHRFQIPQTFQGNHLEQDPGQADTVKVPVAIFQGVVPNIFPHPVKRSDEVPPVSKPMDFTPSKSTSDWIPVTGRIMSPHVDNVRNLNQYGDDFFAELSKKQSKQYSYNEDQPSRKKSTEATSQTIISSPAEESFPSPVAMRLTSSDTIYGRQSSDVSPIRPQEKPKHEGVGDIISGRIPGDHNPFGGDVDRRRGSVLNIGPSSGGKYGDTSNLVVSSVIKFSR